VTIAEPRPPMLAAPFLDLEPRTFWERGKKKSKKEKRGRGLLFVPNYRCCVVAI